MLGSRSWNPFRKEDPKELVRKWQSQLRTCQREVERQMRDLQREEKLGVKQVKEAATRGDLVSAKIIAKQLVNARGAITRLATQKATLVALSAQMSEQLAVARVAGTLKASGETMRLVNDLVKVPQLAAGMRELSREMFKAGVLGEMVDEALDSAVDTEAVEEESAEAVDKVLAEVAGETVAAMAAAPLHRRAAERRPAAAAAETGPEDEELGELQARLAAVRS